MGRADQGPEPGYVGGQMMEAKLDLSGLDKHQRALIVQVARGRPVFFRTGTASSVLFGPTVSFDFGPADEVALAPYLLRHVRQRTANRIMWDHPFYLTPLGKQAARQIIEEGP